MHVSDGDQRNAPAGEKPDMNRERYAEGKPNAHSDTDSKDQRTLSNRLAAAQKAEAEEEESNDAEFKPPTQVARDHGNKPSRGAVVDEEIMNDEAEYLKNKGKA
ncbi:hypothetical protein FRC02_001755 [Tulasnella sp. 418]|nr:hypothetical protein FRC02_001755 [Tulasnella sp. 418]